MEEAYTGMEILLGTEASRRIGRARIAVFGIGAVGSYVTEALARCGVAGLTLTDGRILTKSDCGSHLYALSDTLGMSKAEAARERISKIDPGILVHSYSSPYTPETEHLFDFKSFDYIIDTTDNLSAKCLLIKRAHAENKPIISCMDLGGKKIPSRLSIGDVSRASICPMAKALRKELRQSGVMKAKVLYSSEKSDGRFFVPGLPPAFKGEEEIKETSTMRKGSISFMHGTAGMLIAGEVIRELNASPHGKK